MILPLFLVFLRVGLLSVGGGYAAVPVIESLVVEQWHWLTVGEFTDLLTIAEMTPGPIAVNSATFVGLRIAGIPGAAVATLGCILPSLFLVTLLGMLYRRCHSMKGLQTVLSTLRPAVVALIASAFVTIFLNAVFVCGVISISSIDFLNLILFAAAFIGIRYAKLPPIPVMAGCGVIYMVIGMALELSCHL